MTWPNIKEIVEINPPVPWAAAAPVWGTPVKIPTKYPNEDEKKKLFGIYLAQNLKPFEAGLKVFGSDTAAGLWVSQNWLYDAEVLASKADYLKTSEPTNTLLDKEQLEAKVLAFVDEKDIHGRYLVDAKERLAALKLYAEIKGFSGKVNIDASTKNFTNNVGMIIEFVEPEPQKQQIKTIEAKPVQETTDENSTFELSLVG